MSGLTGDIDRGANKRRGRREEVFAVVHQDCCHWPNAATADVPDTSSS